jgi:hypothetical protein
MTAPELARLVAEMRSAQRESFRTRSPGALEKSRAAERRVDKAVMECLDQPPLFAEEGA